VCRTVAESFQYLVQYTCCTSLCKHAFVCYVRRYLGTSTLTEKRVCGKFCFKLGKTFTETFEMLPKVFDDETMSRARTWEWYRTFKDGGTSTEDDPRLGWPPTSTDNDSIERV
jgi:hypothetical protein